MPGTGRPFWDKDLILFRTGARRYVVLHELTHHLINARHRADSGIGRQEWGMRRTASDVFNDLLDRDETVPESDWIKALEGVLVERVMTWQEEFFINRTLLLHRRALALDPSDVQGIVLSMQLDIGDHFGNLAMIYGIVREISLEHGSPALASAVSLFAHYEREARLQAERQLRAFWSEHREFRAALELAEKEVYLTQPDFHASGAKEILGVRTTRHLDPRSLHLIHWIRVQNLRVTDSESPRHLEKLRAARSLLIDRHKSDRCAAEIQGHIP